jgi:hypothetical protein
MIREYIKEQRDCANDQSNLFDWRSHRACSVVVHFFITSSWLTCNLLTGTCSIL